MSRVTSLRFFQRPDIMSRGGLRMHFRKLILLVAIASAGRAEDTSGLWVLNAAKSKLPDSIMAGVKIEEASGPSSVRDTVELRMKDGRVRLSINPSVSLAETESLLEQTTVVTDSNGKQEVVPYDGMVFSYKSIDKNTSRYVIKQNGKIVQ